MSSSLIRERQQEELLSVLRQAKGAELSYDELREAGIEFPATVVSELQLAGVPVERHYSGGRLQPSFRLDPGVDVGPVAEVAAPAEAVSAPIQPDPLPTEPVAAPMRADPLPTEPVAAPMRADDTPTQEFDPVPAIGHVPWWQRARLNGSRAAIQSARAGLLGLMLHLRQTASAARQTRPRPAGDGRKSVAPPLSPARLLSAAALLAAVVTVTVLALSSLDGGRPANPLLAKRTKPATAKSRRPASRFDQRSQARGHTSPPRTRRAAPRSSASTTTVSVPPQPSAAQLEAQGHGLLDQGQYASAIPVLQQAANATGESPSACAQPTSQNCLTFAFALYDLGVALRLSGNPAAAVPVLQQRLRINVARSTVANELRLAQTASTSTATAVQLEARGHSLLQSGQYTSAIPVLQQAAQATGKSPGACAQPSGESCMTFAFALYDLGVALRLSGNPKAAVSVLQQRLRINNQPEAVAEQLQLAKSAVH